jgi:sterol desaturase/sphingolipid hydroxylase (fatty acid hydroxylase superfamily)
MSPKPQASPKNSRIAKTPRSPGNDPSSEHWLVRPATIRLLWWLFSIILALSVLAQLLFKVKGYFGVDGWLGFGAVFGFLACLAMVLVAKALGWVLKRDEGYYLSRSSEESSGKDSGNV